MSDTVVPGQMSEDISPIVRMSPSPQPLRPLLIGDQMSDMLREAIVSMKFKPGQRLVVRELEEWSGVSRATIRESIRQLAAEGLVTIVPQKGAIVTAPTVEEAREIYEIRAMLEGLIGEQFVERASDAERERLHRAVEAMDELQKIGSGNVAQLAAKNVYYDALYDGAGNTTVRAVLTSFQARISVLRATTLAEPGRAAAVVVELKRVLKAVDANDAKEAAKACRAHVQAAQAVAMKLLNSH